MAKVTPKDKKPGPGTERKTITVKTTDKTQDKDGFKSYKWWLAANDEDLCQQVISTANYLQKAQQYRIKQASIYSRVYSGKPLMNFALNSKLLDVSNQMPLDKPTMNVSQSCADTLVSRITQAKPRPIFLTDGGNYKERKLAKELNAFIMGEFFRCKAYDIGTKNLTDACVLGDGFVKILEKDSKVALERVLETELFADKNDAYYGDPRSLIQLKLCDRDVAAAMFPDAVKKIDVAQKAVVDGSAESTETVSDQLILIEAWHLPSGPDADDGRHVIVCSSGKAVDEPWTKDKFPFVKMGYNANLVGWFSQGLVELLLGTQIEINKILITISKAINLVGVPRIFVDEMSRVLETAFNNNVGTIVKYSGTKPEYSVAPCVPQEMYEQLQRLIQYAYQQSGISALAATSAKPPGLNSGEAIRSYDDLQTDRFAALAKRYENYYVELAYQMIDLAKEIAERDGSYSTVYPNKDGTKEVDLPKASILKDTYVIQCFDESSLPRDPAGRQAKLSEMLAAGEISLQEFRRLSGFPDLEQSDKLANALEERILCILDDIVDTGKFEPPDPFLLDPTDMASTLCVNYINMYAVASLEEKKMQLLRDWWTQVDNMKKESMQPPPMAAGAPLQPQGNLPPPVPPQASTAPTSNVAV